MKKSLFIVMLITVTMLSFVGCDGPAAAPDKKEKKEADSIPVEVTTVTRGDISAYFTGTASLEADNEAQVVAQVSGVVEKILVEEGDHVKEGQIMAQLDDDKFSLDLTYAEAKLNQLKNEYKRNEELFQKKIISAEVFERSRSDFEMQKASVGTSRLMKAYTSIKAPFTGVVGERMIKKGNMVTVNQACFHIADFDPLLAVLHVPEKELSKLKKNQQGIFDVDAIPGAPFYGKILRISPVINSKTGTFKVTLAVKDKEGRLKHGMFARIRVIYDVHADTLLLPKDAVLTEGSESVVFVVKDNKAQRKAIGVGYINRTDMEITSGLETGDTVVRSGIGGLKDGSVVEILGAEKKETETKDKENKDENKDENKSKETQSKN
ncbi:MAG: efflux RND transporter periplasmic adaptor subunit [bacterium]|nr:efflux RND transporter periplasmic adaptor subunit [bacterium]